ncbi:MAG: hypothetical protein FWG87_14280, partial [Defluviitaleaceae bacterium]|nr:hypothetical protein [Defluviitaleaceae bacterium]
CWDLRDSVGDGFIRPEVASLCVNGRYPPRIDERAYLGTDKSVPYKNLRFPLICGLTNDLRNTDFSDLTNDLCNADLCGFARIWRIRSWEIHNP